MKKNLLFFRVIFFFVFKNQIIHKTQNSNTLHIFYQFRAMIKRDYFAWRFNTEWETCCLCCCRCDSLCFFFALYFCVLPSSSSFLLFRVAISLVVVVYTLMNGYTVTYVNWDCMSNRQFSGSCNFFSSSSFSAAAAGDAFWRFFSLSSVAVLFF